MSFEKVTIVSVRTNLQQQQQQLQDAVNVYASVESTDGVVFRKGHMFVNNQPQVPESTYNYESSNGLTNYTAVKWRDPGTREQRVSCNCPGWAIKKPGQPRGCKHTRAIMGGQPSSLAAVLITHVRSAEHAESLIPKLDGRALRSLIFDKRD